MYLIKRDLAELRQQSDALRSGAWRTLTAGERQALITGFCQGYVLPPLAVRAPTAYRAQANDDSKLFTEVKRLLAPPPALVTKHRRLNRAGVPTLYLASTFSAALGETRAAKGTVVSILACRVPPTAARFQFASVAMTRLQGSSRAGPVSKLRAAGALGAPGFKEDLVAYDCLDQWMLQEQTLGELLTSDFEGDDQQLLYEMTNAVREHIYSTWSGYHGVQYPSIVSRLSAPNMALDAPRWGDIVPCEVWVVHAGHALNHYPSGMTTTARPMLALGTVGGDGKITYQRTRKTFLEAAHDFKQRYGFLATGEDWMVPMLSKPWVRHRISYGSAEGRMIFDFLPR